MYTCKGGMVNGFIMVGWLLLNIQWAFFELYLGRKQVPQYKKLYRNDGEMGQPEQHILTATRKVGRIDIVFFCTG